MTTMFVSILTAIFGGVVGWVYAHQVVAKECRKLGRFYVGKSVFICVEEVLDTRN